MAVSTTGAGLTIFPNGLRQLERRGLGEALAAVGATIGEGSLIAAGSVVGERVEIPDRVLAAGSPANVKKALEGEAAKWIDISADEYVKLSRAYLSDEIGNARYQEVVN